MDYRAEILKRLGEDLIGPYKRDEFLSLGEGGQIFPSDLYLFGMLWPANTQIPIEEEDERDQETQAEEEGAADIPVAPCFRPSTMGLAFAAKNASGDPQIEIAISLAVYRPDLNGNERGQRRKEIILEPIRLALAKGWRKIPLIAPDLEDGVYIYIRCSPFQGVMLASAMLVNGAVVPPESGRQDVEQLTLFQTGIRITPLEGTSLVATPCRNAALDESGESASLLYRDRQVFASGYACSARWDIDPDNPDRALCIETTWLPVAKVADMDAGGHAIFKSFLFDAHNRGKLAASALGRARGQALQDLLMLAPSAYSRWLDEQKGAINALEPDSLKRVAEKHLANCEEILARLEYGARKIAADPNLSRAFNLANRAMGKQYGWKEKGAEMIWRPFQLAFILLAAPSMIEGSGPEWLKYRNTMDLLWFPTGGGKTEAYLSLIAILLFYRRLAAGAPGAGEGVAAIMRYTLRLLTTQQFMRASALVFACELIRREDEAGLGREPFSIGLWVGAAATPNKLEEARKALNGDMAFPTPAQLVTCPACGGELIWEEEEDEIHARCVAPDCELGALPFLPVYTVDELIYRHRPSLLIGTVDKFAQLVRKPETNHLFGIDIKSPPDLIIQDELHLLNGPLGSLAGLYEALVDSIFQKNGAPPKIIGSTATIKNAAAQIRCLYNREAAQFPPPCIDADDSGFAVEDAGSPGRVYCGITSAGRSGRAALERVAASILQSVAALSARAADPEELDPWWTLVAYFNSLRELGGALVLLQDETRRSIKIFAAMRGEKERVLSEVNELTSRLSQLEVRDMLGLMETRMSKPGAQDAVLASNMLSVGIDVSRLGVMLVNGQPKSMSEYIQATSRVGRGKTPGLVVTLYNHSRPRDRSHYESFAASHGSLYRDVEPASVTPFAPRARDKALHAILVGMIRHLDPALLEKPDIASVDPQILERVKSFILARASAIDTSEKIDRLEIDRIIARWASRDPEYYWNESKSATSLLQSAEEAAAREASGNYRGEAWPTPNSLRNVEPGTPFRLKFPKKRKEESNGKAE